MRGRAESSAENSPDIIDGGLISSDSEAMSDETEIAENDLFSIQDHLEQAQLEQRPEGSRLTLVQSVGNRETISSLRAQIALLEEICATSERSSDNESQSSGSHFGGSQYNQRRGLNSGV